MKKYAVIVAGGTGSRMNSDIPKQFMEICGRPVLFHTIEAFHKCSADISIILVLPADQFSQWKNLCEKHKFATKIHLQEGGKSRFQSVKKGLEKIPNGDALVAIHDGVRPLVTPATIERSFHEAEKLGSAVAAVPLKESIRERKGNASEARDRSNYFLVQTPQIFNVGELKNAYKTTEKDSLTDDASVAEAGGIKVYLVEGEYENIKITTREDLIVAEAILKSRG